jgi:hypothetical protein
MNHEGHEATRKKTEDFLRTLQRFLQLDRMSIVIRLGKEFSWLINILRAF